MRVLHTEYAYEPLGKGVSRANRAAATEVVEAPYATTYLVC